MPTPSLNPKRPSDQWWSWKSVRPYELAAFTEFYTKLDFQWLSNLANEVHGTCEKCDLPTDRFATGNDHVVFEINFPTTTWIAKVVKPPLPTYDGQMRGHWGLSEWLSEISTIAYVAKHTTIPVPKIFDYNFDASNPFGAPYILMEQVQGRFVQYLPKIPEPYQRHVYRQIADIVLQLSKIQFPMIGLLNSKENTSELVIEGCVYEGHKRSDAFSSAREYYTTRFLNNLRYMESNTSPNSNWIACAWLHLQAIPHFCNPELDKGPFPLWHPDLNNANLLYDFDYNIVGLIDWTGTHCTPWEQFVVPPNQFLQPEYRLQRMLYFDCFEEVEREGNPEIPLSKLMRQTSTEIVELANDYAGIITPNFPMALAMRLTRLVFGDDIQWDDIKRMYQESQREKGIKFKEEIA